MISMDRWGPNDEYPDDPDFECNDCGHPFNAPPGVSRRFGARELECPECGGGNIGGGGYYG